MKVSSFGRRTIAAFVILLALFLVRPGGYRLKVRIANSISQAVARPAEIGSVHLRFLPRPGFDLENLVIYEDPAFGAEPMLRAPEVTAVVRLTSLVRGRLDISRLELTEPSLNLVRRADGRWNWEALLERTARTPLAPTAKSNSEARAGFPYIEASSGRINFKSGAEKKPYALLNADFALWQASENQWGVRLKADPLRGDMSLSDTGRLRMDGTWQRAGSLHETPLKFEVQWEHAQLGQLTKLFSGTDKGWRGDVQVEASLSGTPAVLQIAADAAVGDFHRYDISTSDGLRLAAHCDGKYSSSEHSMRDIFCTGPVGNGMVTLRGNLGEGAEREIELRLNLENVPSSAVAELARRVKKDLPADLTATGSVQGNVGAKEDNASAGGLRFDGGGEFTNLRLHSAINKVEFAIARLPFVLSRQSTSNSSARSSSPRRQKGELPSEPDETRIEYGPFPVALGRPALAQARGWIGRSGYAILVRGDAEISHALRMASMLGLPALRANAEGAAQIDLQIAGSWSEIISGSSPAFSMPHATGTAQLRDVRATVSGLKAPIEISSAELSLTPEGVRIQRINAQAAEAHWTGSMDLPRGCGIAGACLVHFNLNVDDVSLNNLHQWLGGDAKLRPWYQVLSSGRCRS